MNREILRNIIIIFFVYSVTLLFIGRQLAFIPQIRFGNVEKAGAADIRKNVLEKFLKEVDGSYSIYYKDLATGEEFGIDENKVQTGASLNKLPIVSYLYSEAGRGKIDLEERVTVQEDDIQDYGTGSLRYEEPGEVYSLKALTKLALEQSDNTAVYILGAKAGAGNVQNYAKSLGLVATNMEGNRTSAKDMSLLFEHIWSGKVTNTALKLELLDFMKGTDFEDRLVRDMPDGVSVYHKAADGVGFVHDAGIIDDGKKPFILAVLASDIKNEEEAKETIGKIAKFIYDTR